MVFLTPTLATMWSSSSSSVIIDDCHHSLIIHHNHDNDEKQDMQGWFHPLQPQLPHSCVQRAGYFCFDGDHSRRYDDDDLVDDDKGGDNVKDDDHDDYKIMMTMMKVNIFFWQDLFNHLLAMSSLTKQVLKIFIEN